MCEGMRPECSKLFDQVKVMYHDVKAIRQAVLGNGDTRDSLVSRMAAIEASGSTTFKVVAVGATCVAVIVAIVALLK